MTEEILNTLNSIGLDEITKKIVQDNEKKNSGKYKYISKRLDHNDIEYSVTEYVTSNGEIGFDIIFYKKIDDKEYYKSVCYGSEANSRATDWSEIIIN